MKRWLVTIAPDERVLIVYAKTARGAVRAVRAAGFKPMWTELDTNEDLFARGVEGGNG